MKIAYIGTYPPRQCGIGTFTQDLYHSMVGTLDRVNGAKKSFIIAMNDEKQNYAFPPEVTMTIRQERKSDYLKAAEYINNSGVDVCMVQHEFGIYGGQSGVYLLSLLNKLVVPITVTLHTVLQSPTYMQRHIMYKLGELADKIVVMSQKAVSFLKHIYDIPEEKIALLEHGVPVHSFNRTEVKDELGFAQKKVLLTFGLLSRNKGIETVIQALPALVKKHPEVVYVILGKTHPNVLRSSGNEYRIALTKLIRSLHLEEHVIMVDRFVSQEELFKYLYASDIYITPYLSKTQITSGTLSFAVGAGLAVVSTPYWHAEELLDHDRGRLFDFKRTDQLRDILLELLDQPDTMHRIRTNAFEYGKEITWPKIGARYNRLLQSVVEHASKKVSDKDVFDLDQLPPFSMKHVKRLSDHTGIIQHAKFHIPNFNEGYCLDDNARALLMCLMAYHQFKDEDAASLISIYLSYIHYMQNEDGTFHNFLAYDRRFLAEDASEDAFGRTIWALGYLLGNAPDDACYQIGKALFMRAVTHFKELKTVRGIALVINGISCYLSAHSYDDGMIAILKDLSFKLADAFDAHCTKDWHWFEDQLTYDNGILPLALLHVIRFVHDPRLRHIAFKSMDFLSANTFVDGHLSTIGSDKWYKKGGVRSQFDQQPIDTMAMVLMYRQAFMLTHEKQYLNATFRSFLWFLGENDLGICLYDRNTHGCCDGLEEDGVNLNQGAESTLAYQISRLSVEEVYQYAVKENLMRKKWIGMQDELNTEYNRESHVD